jgi:hypothetical protein
MDDLNRGVVHPGGVSASGLQLVWVGVVRPGSEHVVATGVNTLFNQDPRCLQHIAQRPH